jgi:DNA-binding transcriptional LysR family regulator
MIDKLEMFAALARARHFGRAAEACGVTQPTLSSAIRALEDQLGVQLVFRGSRYQGLTAEGERVLDWGRRILSDVRGMRDEVRGFRLGLSGELRLGVIPTALPMVHELTVPLLARHPNLHVSVLSRTSSEILAGIERLDLDAGITYLDNEPLGLPLCLLSSDMQNRRIIDQQLEGAGAAARPRIEANSNIVLISHVMTGAWASVMPQKLAALLADLPGLRAMAICDPVLSHSVGLVAARQDPATPLISALFDLATASR